MQHKFWSDWTYHRWVCHEYHKMIRNPDIYVQLSHWSLFDSSFLKLNEDSSASLDAVDDLQEITMDSSNLVTVVFLQSVQKLSDNWMARLCWEMMLMKFSHQEQLSRWGLPVASVDGALSGKNGVENNLGEQVQQHRTTWDWSEIVEVRLLTCEDFSNSSNRTKNIHYYCFWLVVQSPFPLQTSEKHVKISCLRAW